MTKKSTLQRAYPFCTLSGYRTLAWNCIILTPKSTVIHVPIDPQATLYADHFMIIMSVIMVGMSYQMPVGVGIIQGGGDTKFSMYLNLISVWCIVMPLSFLAAFYWKLPVELVVIAVQSDQIFKCLPIFLRFKSYKWIHKLTAID